jgi:LPS export ABC transporter permease LptG
VSKNTRNDRISQWSRGFALNVSRRPAPHRPGVILYRYLARELLVTTCFALGGFTLVVLTKDFTGYSELVINRGAGIAQVGSIIFFQSLPLMSQMLPFAVLVGGLVGLGRLSNDLEIMVMSALAIEPRQLVAPVALFGAAAAIFGLLLALFAAPWAHRGLEKSLQEIADDNPGAEIQPGVMTRFGDWKLEAREVSGGGRELSRVLLWVPSIGETVFAETAEIVNGQRGGREIALYSGAFLFDTREAARGIRFEEMRTELPSPEDFARSSLANRLAGMRLAALYSMAGDSTRREDALDARSELRRRFVLPTAVALFGALALPLVLSRSRASRSSGAVLGIALTIAYYGLVQVAAGLTERAPELGGLTAWLPNFVLLALTIFLYRQLAKPWAAAKLSARFESSFLQRSRGRMRSAGAVRARRWPLPRYVAGHFLQLSLVCFGALVAAYLLVDILERLQWFARHAASFEEITRFYMARIPLLVSRVVPMGLLVAMALTVSLLTSQGELVGMRSCGISARRALRPTLLVCLLVMPLSFFLNDQIVSRTNELADLIKQRDIRGQGTRRSAIWSTNGRALYQLESLDTSLGTADEIVVYELGANGLPESRVDASRARYVGDGRWRLEEATRIEMTPDGRVHPTPPRATADLGEEPSSELDLMHLSVSETWALIDEFAATGDSTTALEVDLHLKLATPLACMLLPALVMLFAVSGPPFPSSALTLVLASAVAVVYTLAAGAFASFGRGGVLPPWVGGWGPALLASCALVWLGWRAQASQRGR